ncbi:MAG TPA: TfoX/Sxy family protein, partial [Thermoplasmata archaeon]|nr:TfoX/Sxy family protein [Thermoplasmata archaeon]
PAGGRPPGVSLMRGEGLDRSAMKMPKAGAAAVGRFEALVPEHPAVVVKPMFGQPAAFLGGNLLMGVFGEDVFVRLSEEGCAEAVRSAGARPFEPMPGRTMKGYAVLPARLLADPPAARRWVAKALAYVEQLPTKGAKSRGSARPAARASPAPAKRR